MQLYETFGCLEERPPISEAFWAALFLLPLVFGTGGAVSTIVELSTERLESGVVLETEV